MIIKKFHKKFHGGAFILRCIVSESNASFYSYLKDSMKIFKVLKTAISGG